MTEETRAARNAYRREWAKNNPDKVRAQQLRYWTNRAKRAEEEAQAAAHQAAAAQDQPEN